MNGWKTRTLGELLQLNYGKSLPLKSRVGGSIPVYGSNGVVGTHNKAIVEEPGLIVGRKGAAGKVHQSKGPFCPIDTTFYITRCDAPDTDLEFLYYLLLHIDLKRITGDVGVPGLNREMAYLEKASVPNKIPEQKKIAHILSTVQQAIEAQERIIQITTELKKALMHKLFTEGLRNEPRKQTEIGPIPESWDLVSLNDCAVVQTGIAKGRKVKPEDVVEVPYLRVANVQDGHLDLSEMKTIIIGKNEQQRFALQDGDVVLTEGGDFDKLGRGFIWHGQIDNCVHQNHVFAVRPDTSKISSEFFAYQSQSPYGKSYFLSVAHKTTNLACINTTKLKAFPVLLPPSDQQKGIVDVCHSIDDKIRVTQTKQTRLQDLFRTLLHELMTAKIRINNPGRNT